MKARVLLLFLGTGLLSGCFTSGFTRKEPTARGSGEPLLVTDGPVAEAHVLKPQLHLPCRIAVYLRPAGQGWHWTAKDGEAVEAWEAALRQAGVVSDMFVLPDMIAGKAEREDVKDLRTAAARCGADALLVVQGSAEVDEYSNAAAVLNLTILGGYIIPSSHRDARFRVEGVLFDVNNGYIYAGFKADGEGKVVRPAFIVESKDAVARAQSAAMDRFGPEVVKRLANLAR